MTIVKGSWRSLLGSYKPLGALFPALNRHFYDDNAQPAIRSVGLSNLF